MKFVFSEKCCSHRWSFLIYFYSVEPSKKTPVIFFHLLSRVKLFFFSEKVGISQNCILTLLSTFLLFFFSEFILIIKNFPTFFCLVRKNEFHPWKKFISLNSIHEKIYFLTCFVTRCIMYFFMYEADWKHFFLAETFFFMGIFLCVCVCWAECKTFGFFLAFICL